MANFYMNYSDAQIERLINGLYAGEINRDKLPVDLYEAIKDRLNEAVFKGFGGTYADFSEDTAEGLIMAGFEKNIAVFSGAKTFQQVNDLSNFIFSGKDKIPFGEFKAHATEILDEYNKNWLKTEYNTAISQASSGRHWSEIKSKAAVFPLLKYQTVGDGRVREEHKKLDEIIRPVGDAFWKNYFPPNDWNCRCIVEQIEEDDEPVTDLTGRSFDDVPDLFKMNAGEDKIIFDESVHPYFKVDKRYKVALGENFGLPFEPQVKPKAPRKPRQPKAPQPTAPTPDTFAPATSIKEFKSRIIDTFEKNSNFKIAGVTVSSSMELEAANLRLETLEGLLKEYNIGDTVLMDKPAKVSFREAQSFYGKVTYRGRANRVTRSFEGLEIVDMNFGTRTDMGASRVFDSEGIVTRGKSAVDAANNLKATVVHEFGHVIAMSESSRVKGSKAGAYMDELFGIRKQYQNEMFALNQAGDKNGVYKISLGRYASTNLDEFHAEAFTEYKLKKEPSKYAKMVGELIDKYFKK